MIGTRALLCLREHKILPLLPDAELLQLAVRRRRVVVCIDPLDLIRIHHVETIGRVCGTLADVAPAVEHHGSFVPVQDDDGDPRNIRVIASPQQDQRCNVHFQMLHCKVPFGHTVAERIITSPCFLAVQVQDGLSSTYKCNFLGADNKQ